MAEWLSTTPLYRMFICVLDVSKLRLMPLGVINRPVTKRNIIRLADVLSRASHAHKLRAIVVKKTDAGNKILESTAVFA